MSKPKFDVSATAKKFLSGVPEETAPQPEQKEAAPAAVKKKTKTESSYIPESKSIGANRPKSIDKDTGEVTKQIGYFVTESQDDELRLLAVKLKTNKSALLREAIRMYLDYLENEGIK